MHLDITPEDKMIRELAYQNAIVLKTRLREILE